MITVFVVFQTTAVLAREKQGIIKPSNAKGETQLDHNANTTKITHVPVLIDPHNPDSAVSGSLGVDIRYSKPDCPWIHYSVSATEWGWFVRKPGNYASICLTGTIASNVDLVINFMDFGDFRTPIRIGAPMWSLECQNKELETYYSATLLDIPASEVEWHRAIDFNKPENDLFIPKNPNEGTHWNLWTKICVTADVSACTFIDRAWLSFEMGNTKTWTDPEISK